MSKDIFPKDNFSKFFFKYVLWTNHVISVDFRFLIFKIRIKVPSFSSIESVVLEMTSGKDVAATDGEGRRIMSCCQRCSANMTQRL